MASLVGGGEESKDRPMSADIGDLKAALRHRLRAEGARFSRADRAAASAQICARLKQQGIWRQARSILFYVPLPEEPDIWPLLTEALRAGKIVSLPHYSLEQSQYLARRVADPDRDLGPGRFGIPEPKGSCPAVELMHLDLTLVPGIGFNLDGYRLGRGRGYYDRLLALVPGLKCGVAFDWQVSAEIPVEPYDIRLNCILTPTLWQKW